MRQWIHPPLWLVLSAALVAQESAAKAPGRDSIARDEITFHSGELQLAATLLHKIGERAPAVVMVHGSGDSDRSNPWTLAWAEALAARGIVVLHPDKRGCGASKGDWKVASFSALANDVAAAVDFLRHRPEVDVANVGVIGFSQGVDVVPVCAARAKACDFVVAVSGSVVPLCEQIVDEIDLGASRTGKPIDAAQRLKIDAAHRLAMRCATEGGDFEALKEELQRITDADPALEPAVRGLRAAREHWVWKWVRAVGDFDPAPFWQQVQAPMLFVYGGSDTKVMGAKSVARLRQILADPKYNWSVLEFARNGHALIRDDLVDFTARWIRDRGAH